MSHRPPVVLIPQHFGSLVFDRRTSRYLPFDREATDLLLALRNRSIESIAREAEGDRAEALRAFHEHFYRQGLFRLDGRFAGEVLPLDPPADHLAGPLAVHLEIVAACNLSCAHCFASPLPRGTDPLTLVELDGLFGTFARLGSFRLGLTGGEPLLRRDLFEIVDAAVGRGLHPCLTTNGLRITEEIAREFGRRELAWLNVSLDGAGPETNDRIRGAGTFERVLANLRILARHARFTLAFTLTRASVGEAAACADLARRVGAHAAVFRPLYPVGTAARHPELMPTWTGYADALRSLDGDLHSFDPFSPQARADRQGKVYANVGCGAANLVCSISVDGTVNPCSFLGPAHDAGNVRRAPFEEIWHRSPVFVDLRGRSGAGFRGGCRARALAFHGSAHAEDPWQREWEAAGGPSPTAILERET